MTYEDFLDIILIVLMYHFEYLVLFVSL